MLCAVLQYPAKAGSAALKHCFSLVVFNATQAEVQNVAAEQHLL